MTINILQAMIFNIMLILSLLIVGVFKITDYLIDKPKSNKFRQWWSNHIADIDNRYED
jgi:cell shape-determining protein MreC